MISRRSKVNQKISQLSITMEGREEGREGGREGGRERGREGKRRRVYIHVYTQDKKVHEVSMTMYMRKLCYHGYYMKENRKESLKVCVCEREYRSESELHSLAKLVRLALPW